MTKKYRPSNGTEGMDFMDDWCAQCRHDTDEKPCMILGRTLAYSIDDPEYPTEWIRDEHGPRCTAYKPTVKEGEPEPAQRCDKTKDMFT